MLKSVLTLSFVAFGALLLAACGDDDMKPQNIVCESTFALCTTAKCTPIEEG